MSSQSKRRRVRFQIRADRGSQVWLAGSFNDWNTTSHRLKYRDGLHSLNVLLPPGRYEYKFIVDGVWCVDPDCKEWSANEHGSLNSVLTVA
ncbi:MAG: glycogen-binding domain-containing protein [Anaerolineae bacterium]